MSDVIAAPSVRARALNLGIDLEKLARDLGRTTIALEDLHGSAKPAAQGPDHGTYWAVDHGRHGPVSEEATSRIARVAAANLAAAHSVIPPVTHHDRADATAIETFRATLKDEGRARGIKLTGLAFQVLALARVLEDFPDFNASLSPDGKTLVRKGYVHIGIAVDTDHGLMVPVIRDAADKGLWQIAADIADLAGRAQARRLGPEDMGGASMSISNLGGIGGRAFTPIVNPPELAILGITRTEISPVWDGTAFVPRPMIPLDLTYDHRVINGAGAARFMAALIARLEEPRLLMI